MSSGKNRLNIHLMGAPEIHIASANPAALPLNHLKALALLFYLAATRQALLHSLGRRQTRGLWLGESG